MAPRIRCAPCARATGSRSSTSLQTAGPPAASSFRRTRPRTAMSTPRRSRISCLPTAAIILAPSSFALAEGRARRTTHSPPTRITCSLHRAKTRRYGDPRLEGRDIWQPFPYRQTIGFGRQLQHRAPDSRTPGPQGPRHPQTRVAIGHHAAAPPTEPRPSGSGPRQARNCVRPGGLTNHGRSAPSSRDDNLPPVARFQQPARQLCNKLVRKWSSPMGHGVGIMRPL